MNLFLHFVFVYKLYCLNTKCKRKQIDVYGVPTSCMFFPNMFNLIFSMINKLFIPRAEIMYDFFLARVSVISGFMGANVKIEMF